MDYDFLVIGGGSGGYAAARTAADLGMKTAVVESGPEIGGLCILRGCMPSKTLIESANRYLTLRRADEFGLRAGGIGYYASEIIARKRRLIGEFADYRREQLESGKFDFLLGRASFIDTHAVAIAARDGSERCIQARSILISTGSVINTPAIPGLEEAGYLTSDDVLDRPEIPKSIIVLGAGPVALEMAHYFNALGSRVTIIQRSGQLLKGVDEDLAGVVEKAFRKRGFEIFTETKLVRVETDGAARKVVFEHAGGTRVAEAEAILNALGRAPNTAGLGLERAGVRTSGAQIKTAATQQTDVPHIFAAGDCCGPYEIVHIAIEQGEIAARNAKALLDGSAKLQKIDYRLKLYVVFTEPQVAAVGLSEIEAKAQGLDFAAASYPFDDHGKSMVMGETEGFVKLLADRASGEILGGSVVGPHASDLIHEIVVAMEFRATAAQLAAIPHYHPTLSEIWTYPASDLAGLGG